jgi:hypothetical protein
MGATTPNIKATKILKIRQPADTPVFASRRMLLTRHQSNRPSQPVFCRLLDTRPIAPCIGSATGNALIFIYGDGVMNISINAYPGANYS